ncbi:MAG: hypothetical protein H7144_02870 [Burkholderiales bacterium]|nr:hypothetical protein [Phycisphaerae bacterium]
MMGNKPRILDFEKPASGGVTKHQPARMLLVIAASYVGLAMLTAVIMRLREKNGEEVIQGLSLLAIFGLLLFMFLVGMGLVDLARACRNPVQRMRGIILSTLVLLGILIIGPVTYLCLWFL